MKAWIVAATVGLLATGWTATLEERVDGLWPTAEEEKYLSVGWRLNLMEARREAQETGKPLFLWMMNGHPTGCT